MLALWCASLACAPAVAADPSCGPPAEGDVQDAATVRSIGPGASLILADGRTLRLAGVALAEASTDAARPDQDASSAATARLAAWLVNRSVQVRILGDRADRWNRWPALVFAATPGATPGADLLAVNLAMVDAGLGRAMPEPGIHACWAALRNAEAAARSTRLGLWADSDYAVRKADDGAALAALAGRFAIVEGRVAHVGASRGTVYVDLGPRHRALALRMTRRVAASLDQGGPGHDAWVGRWLVARGVLDNQDGPVMDIGDADQVELGDTGGGAPP